MPIAFPVVMYAGGVALFSIPAVAFGMDESPTSVADFVVAFSAFFEGAAMFFVDAVTIELIHDCC